MCLHTDIAFYVHFSILEHADKLLFPGVYRTTLLLKDREKNFLDSPEESEFCLI